MFFWVVLATAEAAGSAALHIVTPRSPEGDTVDVTTYYY